MAASLRGGGVPLILSLHADSPPTALRKPPSAALPVSHCSIAFPVPATRCRAAPAFRKDLSGSPIRSRSPVCFPARVDLPVVCDANAAQTAKPWAAFRRAALGVGVGLGGLVFLPQLNLDALVPSLLGGGGGAGGAGGTGGGGGSGAGGGKLFGSQAAHALDLDEEEDDEDGDAEDDEVGTVTGGDEDGDATFLCEGVRATNLVAGPGIPTQAELFEGLNCTTGATVTRKQLSTDMQTLLETGLFQNVDAEVKPEGKGYIVEFTFREKIWPAMDHFTVSGSTILPDTISDEVLTEAQKSQYTTVRVLAAAKNIVEGYYQERGLTFGTISHFDGMETGNVIAHIIEGEIASVNCVYLDDKGGQSASGSTKPHVVERELPFKVGELYNVEDAKRALRDIFLLQLFDNVQVVPKPNEEEQQKVDVDIVLRERPLKTAEVELEWGIAPSPPPPGAPPGGKGMPELVDIRPGGSIFFEHRNLQGEGRQLYGSVSTSNFFAPQDDLGFKLEYVRPYIFGEDDPNRTGMNLSAFNSRKLSPVFTGGPFADEVPAIWVDRAGAKVTATENFTRQSKLTYGLVMEEITTRDEQGAVCVSGMRNTGLPDGPPTTFSDSGTDRVAFLQGNLTRDCTYFCNGVTVGARDIWQMDQGVGVLPSNPFYNRTSLSSTRFIMLKQPGRTSEMPPPVLVLHAKGGVAIGDLPSYDAFVLGGPYSVRGYNVGELAACRRVLETAVELRLPVPKLNSHAYAFYEYGTDLGSSKELAGNPTEFYRRLGSGAAWGGGLRLGAVRAEYCVDGNTCKGNFFFRFGERF